jgi:methylene-tetrahydromethanopterin dehydrogenase
LKSLEITALDDQNLKVFIVEKEYSEPFRLSAPPSDSSSNTFSVFKPSSAFSKQSAPTNSASNTFSVFKPTIVFTNFLEKLVDEVNPTFATEEQGIRSTNNFIENNVIAQLFQKKGIPFFPTEMDENARSYVASILDEKTQLRDRMLKALDELNSSPQKTVHQTEKEHLVAYGQCLQQEIDDAERELKFSVRESWIAMGILENARNLKKAEITCLHISSPEHVSGVKKILESVNVEVQTITPTKKLITTQPKATSEELEDLLTSMKIQVQPVIKKSSEDAPYILVFLDTGKRASPFDICMAYDAGFNTVIPYENVSVTDSKKIVQDAIFSRDPKGIKRTCFFIGGKDMDKAEEILTVVRDSMFPPFETNIIIDPAGAYTTASAMIAKVEEAMTRSKLGALKGKRCAIFGTGAIGRVAAVLLARLGCNVTIVSLNPNRVNGEEYAENLASHIGKTYGVTLDGVFAPTPVEKLKVLKKAEVIFCAAVAGTQIISKEMLKEVQLSKVIADVNAVPPLGVEGMKLNDDLKERIQGIFGIGALTIGRLKYKLEKEILKEARINGKSVVYNYNYAFQLARKLIKEELTAKKIAVTMSYPLKK